MSAPDSFVFCSPFEWGGAWQSTHYVAELAARTVPVLYVEPPPLWNPRVPGFSAARLFAALTSRALRQPGAGLHVFTPLNYPYGRSAAMRERNSNGLVRGIENGCRRLGFRRPLYWMMYYEGCLEHARKLAGLGYVYYCLDHHDFGDPEEERELARGARLVFAVSPPLATKHVSNNARTFLLPNGVNLEWFSKARLAGAERPRDLPTTEGPIIGFVGLLNRHVDLGLLLEVAVCYPHAFLVLVGPLLSEGQGPAAAQGDSLTALQKLKNVRFLGFKEAWELPRYIEAFDVCLLPTLPTPRTWHTDPLKVSQYFALGKPVVSFIWPALEVYAPLLYGAASHADFTVQVGRALAESPATPAIAARISVAASRNWPDVVRQACGHIEQVFRNGRT